MFAKSDWFKLTRSGRGVAPSGWIGWTYLAVWAGVICLPALLLASRPGQKAEALVWLVAMSGLFFWDRRDVLRHLRGETSPASRSPTVTASATNTIRTGQPALPTSSNDVFYIGDDNQPAAGEEYVFRLRR
jgi:hypothetical protein